MEEGLASAPVTFVSEQRVFVILAVSAHILISQAGLVFVVQAKDTHTYTCTHVIEGECWFI